MEFPTDTGSLFGCGYKKLERDKNLKSLPEPWSSSLRFPLSSFQVSKVQNDYKSFFFCFVFYGLCEGC